MCSLEISIGEAVTVVQNPASCEIHKNTEPEGTWLERNHSHKVHGVDWVCITVLKGWVWFCNAAAILTTVIAKNHGNKFQFRAIGMDFAFTSIQHDDLGTLPMMFTHN